MSFESGRIEKRVLIQASPAIVFKALTEARDLVRWFCDRAASDVREGGEITAVWKSEKENTKGKGIFTRLLPGALVEITWSDEGGGPVENARHVFRYTIQQKRGTTEVDLLDQEGPTMDEESFSVLNEGWNYVLQDLKDYCERRERAGKPRQAEEE
jgi:uncharacterized protein YndB with AHSA1/START domain